MSIKQNTPEWEKLRINYIGASDAPIILGISPWRNKEELLNEKLGIIPSQKENFNMRRGKERETEALRCFERQSEYLMMSKVFFHHSIEFMMASIDGWDLDNKAILEIKCPGKKDHDLALQGKIPEKYFPQLQHQLEVTGHEKMFYMSYRSDEDFKILEVYRDADYISMLLKIEHDFWNDLQRLKIGK